VKFGTKIQKVRLKTKQKTKIENLEGLIPEHRADTSRVIISSENEVSEAESQDSDVLRRVRNPTRFQNNAINPVVRGKSKNIAV